MFIFISKLFPFSQLSFSAFDTYVSFLFHIFKSVLVGSLHPLVKAKYITLKFLLRSPPCLLSLISLQFFQQCLFKEQLKQELCVMIEGLTVVLYHQV